jgi:hypothetical protein
MYSYSQQHICLLYNRWIKKRSLTEPRCHANLLLVMGHLWLIGGRARMHTDGSAALASMTTVEQYDSDNDVWNHVTNLDQARHDAGAVALGLYNTITLF